MNPSLSNVSASELKRAAGIKASIEELESELEDILGTAALSTLNHRSSIRSGTGGKNNMSAAGRARIRAAQKARWAKFRANKGPAPAPKRRMSPAARGKIAAIARARWRKAKAAGRNAL